MTRVVVDAEMLKKLQQLSEPLDLTDEAGNVLAHVTPALNPNDWEFWEPPIDEEELLRRESSNERRYTTEEVLRHLENL